MAIHYFYSASSTLARIDKKSGVIHGISIITQGEAKGHDIEIDHKTLEQIKECSLNYKSGLKVKLDHQTGVTSIIGLVKNFSIVNDKLVGDLYIIQSHPMAGFVMDLIESQPDTVGFSVHFSGVNQEVDGKNYARCDEIYSCDLVCEPAANPSGTFERKDITEKENEMKKEIKKIENQFEGSTWDVRKGAPTVDTKEQSMAAKTAPTEDKNLKSEKESPSLEERLSSLESKLEAFFEKDAELKKGKAMDEEEMDSQDDGDEDDKKPAKKQKPVESYEEEKVNVKAMIAEGVVLELARIGVSAIKANPQGDNKKEDSKEKTFEELVAEQVNAGKSPIEAMKFCVANHQNAHDKFLSSGGGHFKI